MQAQPWERALERASVVFDRPNGPGVVRPVRWHFGRQAQTDHHFRTGRPEYVMPVGAGNLSAMVSFGSDNLELLLSKGDYVVHEDGTVSRDPEDRAMQLRSPGRVTVRFDALTTNEIVRFRQRMDLLGGCVTLSVGTAKGDIDAEIFGDRESGALVVSVADRRAGVRRPTIDRWLRARAPLAFAERAEPDGRLALLIAPDAASAASVSCADLSSLRAASRRWWRDYWARSWVSIEGDARARKLERQFYVFFYSMAVNGYGFFPPKFNGGPGLVEDNYDHWEVNLAWQNTRDILWALGPGNRGEILKRYLDFYLSALERLPGDTAWASAGPEWRLSVRESLKAMYSSHFSDAKGHPIDVAAPYVEPTEAELEAMLENRRKVPLGYIRHIFSPGAELLHQMIEYVRFTGDRTLLPGLAKLLRTQTELYVLLSMRGEDGKWHVRWTNTGESWHGVDDGIMDLAAARLVFAFSADRGRELGFPDSLVAAAAKRRDAMADFPTGCPYAFPGGSAGGIARILDDVKAEVFRPCVITNGQRKFNQENNELYVVHPFAMAGRGRLRDVALETWRRGPYADGGKGWTPVGIAVARLRDPKAADCIFTHADRSCCWPFGGGYSPGMKLWEGSRYGSVVYLDAMAVAATGVEELLLQSHPDEPKTSFETGGAVSVCPCVPKSWTGAFRLLARGGFVVEATFAGGEAKSVRVTSLRGNDFACEETATGKVRTRPTAVGETFELNCTRTKPGHLRFP